MGLKPGADGYGGFMRNFVVASWEPERHRERRLHQVEAETAEHAVVVVAATGGSQRHESVYEAWPAERPSNNIRFVFDRPGAQLSLRL